MSLIGDKPVCNSLIYCAIREPSKLKMWNAKGIASLTIMTYLCHKWPRKCSTNMGQFNGKNTNSETIWNNFDNIIYNTNPKPNPVPTLTLTLTVHDLVFSKYSTHLYLWFYSIVITLKHGQNCKHASDGRIMLFLCL